MSSRYVVEISAPAFRDLQRIPRKVAEAILAFCDSQLAENPRRVGKPLRREYAGRFSARRGDYRVMYSITEEAKKVRVLVIDHRSHVYRPGR